MRWQSEDRFGTAGFGDRLPNAALTGVQVAGAMVLLGLVAVASDSLMLFGALGATALLQMGTPLGAPASPRNTAVGHATAFAAGALSLVVFGLWDAGPASAGDVAGPRIAACALALGITATVLIAFDRQHLAAGASTVVIALGEVDDYLVTAIGIATLTLYSFITNRARGIPYPRWAPKPARQQDPQPGPSP